MSYSLTQAGNLGQILSFILVMTGMSKEEADGGVAAVLITVGIVGHLVSFVAGWIGRFRKGDVTLTGFRK